MKRCEELPVNLRLLFHHPSLNGRSVVMGTVSELCASSFQAFLCPTVRAGAPAAASGKYFCHLMWSDVIKLKLSHVLSIIASQMWKKQNKKKNR